MDDVGKRLDGFRRMLAGKLLDAVSRSGATTGIAGSAGLKASVDLFCSCSQGPVWCFDTTLVGVEDPFLRGMSFGAHTCPF